MTWIRIMKGEEFFAIAADSRAADRLVYAYRNTYVYDGPWFYQDVNVEITEPTNGIPK